jgi:hypothetical protein
VTRVSECGLTLRLTDPWAGHRLKSANNKTSTMFKSLRTPRRIILSGTPIQNDLSEFHAMVSMQPFFDRVAVPTYQRRIFVTQGCLVSNLDVSSRVKDDERTIHR